MLHGSKLFSDGGYDAAVYAIDHKMVDVNEQFRGGMTPLIIAAKNNRIDLVKYLLYRGADIEKKDDRGRTALLEAAKYGNTHIVKILINNDADVNTTDDENNSPLGLASYAGIGEMDNYIEIVKILINSGADVDIIHVSGQTPLMIASSRDNSEIVKILLDYGADIDAVDMKGHSARDYARKFERKHKYSDVIKILEKHKRE